jgi:hypothetical protein
MSFTKLFTAAFALVVGAVDRASYLPLPLVFFFTQVLRLFTILRRLLNPLLVGNYR